MNSSTSSSEHRLASILARTFCFALLTWGGLAAGSEALLRGPVTLADPFSRHREFFRAADASDAAFGDSHVARGFLGTAEMPNLAYLSESIAQTAFKVRSYFEHRKPGRVLLLGAPHQFSAARMDADVRDYEAIFGEGRDPYALLRLADPYHRARLGRYWQTFLEYGFVLTPAYTFGAHGALLSDATIGRSGAPYELAAAERVASLVPASDFEHADAAVRYVELVHELVGRGAKVCIVTFPVTPGYRKYSDRDPRFSAARRFIEGTARSARVPYVSYWSSLDDETLFADADHLNRAGATWLTPRVLEDCFGAPGATASGS